MAQVTGQYLKYVDEIRSRNLELAAEYLRVAALLIEIKSRMLLPISKKRVVMKLKIRGLSWCVVCWNMSGLS